MARLGGFSCRLPGRFGTRDMARGVLRPRSTAPGDPPKAPASARPPHRRPSIGVYLGAVIALQALLFSALTIAAGFGDYRQETRQTADSSARTAKLAADLIASSVKGTAAQMASEVKKEAYRAVFDAPGDCVLTSGGTDAFARTDIHLISLDGSVVCSSLRPDGAISYAGSGWLEQLTAAPPATPVISGVVVDPLIKEDAVIVAAKTSDSSGALVTSLRVDSLPHGLVDRFSRSGSEVTFAVTSADRRTLLAGSSGHPGQGLRDSTFGRPLKDNVETVVDLDGAERIYGEAKVSDLGWHVWAGVSADEALADAREAMRETLLLGLAALVVVLIVGAYIRRRITRPVRSLAAAVDEAAEGNLGNRVPVDGPRELANLGERFNNMLGVRERSEQALVAAYEKERCAAESLRELDTMKTGFLLAISHELRTPLTSVVGYASLLEDSWEILSEDERIDSSKRIASQARRLERLLVDLLDVERMSRGTIEAHRRDVDLRELVLRVIENTSGATRVSVKIRADLQVYVDAGLMERVTENLIVNAIKHTPPETNIVVRASRSPEGVVLVVEDGGPGVPDGLKTEIFEAFRQGDVPDHAPGTGIGLALVNQFAKLHGGHAWVQDRPGGGASFRVLLPTEVSKKRSRTKKGARRTRVAEAIAS